MIESYTFRIENEQRRNVHFGMFVSSEWFKLGTTLSNNMCNPVTRIKLLLFWKIRLEMYIILSYLWTAFVLRAHSFFLLFHHSEKLRLLTGFILHHKVQNFLKLISCASWLNFYRIRS